MQGREKSQNETGRGNMEDTPEGHEYKKHEREW